jgi:hypothetical protein
MPNSSAISAVLNNAAWCDAVCCAAGGLTEFANGLWRNAVLSPAYFPNIITIDSAAKLGGVEEAIRKLAVKDAQVAVKDSFRNLNLAPIGFSKLFDASWIWRDPVPRQDRSLDLT